MQTNNASTDIITNIDKELILYLAIADTIKDFYVTGSNKVSDSKYINNISIIIKSYISKINNITINFSQLRKNSSSRFDYEDFEHIQNLMKNDDNIELCGINTHKIKNDIIRIKNKEEELIIKSSDDKHIQDKVILDYINDKNIHNFIINDKSFLSDKFRNKEFKDISTLFNAMNNNQIEKIKNQLETSPRNSFKQTLKYSLNKSDNELLLFDKIEIVNQNIILYFSKNDIKQSCTFNKDNRINKQWDYSLGGFAKIINNIKNILNKYLQSKTYLNSKIKSQQQMQQTQSNIYNNFVIENDIYKLISDLLKLKLKYSDQTNSIHTNTNEYIYLKPLEYIYALFDIKRAMDWLQIKLCLQLNKIEDNDLSYYLSNDIISIAFSSVYNCPTIFHKTHKNKRYTDPIGLYEIKNKEKHKRAHSPSLQTHINITKKPRIQTGGLTSLYNTNKINSSTKTYTRKNLFLGKTFKNIYISKVSEKSPTFIKTSSSSNPKNILKKKIKLLLIKELFSDNIEFIEFIDKLSFITKSITYFDFFLYHFIFI